MFGLINEIIRYRNTWYTYSILAIKYDEAYLPVYTIITPFLK